MLKPLFIGIGILMGFTLSIGCNKNKTIGPIVIPEDTPGEPITLDSFPLALGHEWKYEIQEQSYQGTSQNAYDVTYTYQPIKTSYLTIRTISDTMVEGFKFTKMGGGELRDSTTRSLFSIDGIPGRTNFYYVMLPNGLHEHYDLTGLDSAAILDNNSGEFVLGLPARGQGWYSYTIEFYRDWTDYVKVQTPAGSFQCIKLEGSNQHYNTGNNTSQYISNKGIVQIVRHSYSASTFLYTGTRWVVKLISTNF